MIDGEYLFFVQKLVNLYIQKGIDNCVTRVGADYSLVGEPCPQKRCIDQARWEYYAYASEVYPARKGMKCEYEDHECFGSDAVGCTYCCCQPPEYPYDVYYGEV